MHYLQQTNFKVIKRSASIAISILMGLGASTPQAFGISEAKDVIAIQLRAQGIPCRNPSKAIRDIPDSSPDEMAWIITCKEATYRVKLIPHVGSKVDIVEDAKPEIDPAEMKE